MNAGKLSINACDWVDSLIFRLVTCLNYKYKLTETILII